MKRLASLTALLLLACPGKVRAGEDYYLLMFGAQSVPANPNYAHSFATFVRASWEGDGPCPQNPCIEAHTISWLPATMVVRTHALFPECGRNFDLHTTIRWCQDNCMRVSLWGPYRICPDLYYLALKQKAHLESGAVRFKALDSFRNTQRVTNCIHALADVLDERRVRIASPGFGETASFVILKRYEPFILDRDCPQSWVVFALGLEQYPIIYRDFGRPFSGVLGPVFRLLGGERDLCPTYGPPAY